MKNKLFYAILMIVIACALSVTNSFAEISSPSVIGGKNSAPDARSWMVALVYKQPNGANPQFCGGTLISPTVVLTAAHCVKYKFINEFQVLGETQNLRSGGKRADIDQVIIHPGYNSGNNDNDIAILKIKNPLNKIKSSYVDISNANNIQSSNLIVAGWGQTQETDSSRPANLQEAIVPLIDKDVCRNAYKKISKEITDNMICASSLEGGKDACGGDSGGPLFYEKENKTTLDKLISLSNGPSIIQVGIVSWGVGCADKNFYGIYTDVSKYTGWIKKYL